MSLVARKTAELEHKLASVKAEFGEWREVTAPHMDGSDPPPEPALEKHRSQVLRVTRALEAFAQGVDDEIAASVAAGDVLGRAPLLEQEILEVHRLWEYFRSKFALRLADWLAPYLAAADDLAFACYSPAQAVVPREHADGLKEPPLVYFSGASSPLAIARGETYEAEVVLDEPLRRARADLTRRLPIPVIEIPWSQRSHLPDAPTICHEVGHIVEYDLRLTSRLHALLAAALDTAGAPPARRGAWTLWLGEVFADVYGCLGAGPAFPLALLDLLAPEALSGVTDVRYPPADVRIELNAVALERTGHEVAGAELRTRWADEVGGRRAQPASDGDGFAADVAGVVDGLLAGPYPEFGDKALTDILCFTSEDQSQAQAAADRVVKGKTPLTKVPRRLHAAARLAFDQRPDAYDLHDAGDAIVRRVMASRETGPRARVAKARDVDALQPQDEATGSELLSLVRGWVARPA